MIVSDLAPFVDSATLIAKLPLTLAKLNSFPLIVLLEERSAFHPQAMAPVLRKT